MPRRAGVPGLSVGGGGAGGAGAGALAEGAAGVASLAFDTPTGASGGFEQAQRARTKRIRIAPT
jgi:hypothetical protein